MNDVIQAEWEKLTGSKENKLAEEIDKLSTQGLSAIQIAGRLNLRVSLVWKYLQTKTPKILKAAG
jgi:hypothetical protein